MNLFPFTQHGDQGSHGCVAGGAQPNPVSSSFPASGNKPLSCSLVEWLWASEELRGFVGRKGLNKAWKVVGH